MITTPIDELNLAEKPEIKAIIFHETLYYSGKVVKLNKWGLNQERTFIITDQAIYNLEKKEVKRKFEIKKIMGITLSKKTDSFIIHGISPEYDYLVTSTNKFKIIEMIEIIYEALTSKELLFSIKDTNKLSIYVVTKKERLKKPDLNKMDLKNLMSIREYIESEGNVELNTHSVSLNLENNFFRPNQKFRDEKIENFEFLNIIYKGNNSCIYLANYKKDKKKYALKIIDKIYIINNNLIEQIKLEKNILSSFNDQCFCELKFFFMTETKIIFVMPFYEGGDLFQALINKKSFDESTICFWGVQIAFMFKLLHEQKIIYRDLKPENLIINHDGYLKLIDFGCAKIIENNNDLSSSFCGSPSYVSPEIINGDGHNLSTDWWSFGILLYELFYGFPPFYDRNLERNFDLIRYCKINFPSKKIINKDLKDLIMKLCEKDKEKRLGSKNDFDEVIQHPFFKNSVIENIKNKMTNSPYTPVINDDGKLINFDEAFTNMKFNEKEIEDVHDLNKLRQFEEEFELFKEE